MPFPSFPDGLEKELVFEFFWKFSAFECALKRAGYLNQISPNAQADWVKFVSDKEVAFQQLGEPFDNAIGLLTSNKPRKQIQTNGLLEWQEVQPQTGESDHSYGFRLLKVVRNNLFHGGKYPDGPEPEIARNRELLQAALVILDGCYQVDSTISNHIAHIAT